MNKKSLELGPAFFHNLRKDDVDTIDLATKYEKANKLEEQIGNFHLSIINLGDPCLKYRVAVFKRTGRFESIEPQVQETFTELQDALIAYSRARRTLKSLQKIYGKEEK